MNSKTLMGLFIAAILAGCALTAGFPPENGAESLRLIDQGVDYLRRGDLQRARISFLLSYDLIPSAPALDGVGCADVLQGEYAGAELAFQRVRDSHPDYAPVYTNQATLALLRGNSERAVSLLREALRREPGNARVRNNLAMTLKFARGTAAKEDSAAELLKAEALQRHPLILRNEELLISSLIR